MITMKEKKNFFSCLFFAPFLSVSDFPTTFDCSIISSSFSFKKKNFFDQKHSDDFPIEKIEYPEAPSLPNFFGENEDIKKKKVILEDDIEISKKQSYEIERETKHSLLRGDSAIIDKKEAHDGERYRFLWIFSNYIYGCRNRQNKSSKEEKKKRKKEEDFSYVFDSTSKEINHYTSSLPSSSSTNSYMSCLSSIKSHLSYPILTNIKEKKEKENNRTQGEFHKHSLLFFLTYFSNLLICFAFSLFKKENICKYRRKVENVLILIFVLVLDVLRKIFFFLFVFKGKISDVNEEKLKNDLVKKKIDFSLKEKDKKKIITDEFFFSKEQNVLENKGIQIKDENHEIFLETKKYGYKNISEKDKTETNEQIKTIEEILEMKEYSKNKNNQGKEKSNVTRIKKQLTNVYVTSLNLIKMANILFKVDKILSLYILVAITLFIYISYKIIVNNNICIYVLLFIINIIIIFNVIYTKIIKNGIFMYVPTTIKIMLHKKCIYDMIHEILTKGKASFYFCRIFFLIFFSSNEQDINDLLDGWDEEIVKLLTTKGVINLLPDKIKMFYFGRNIYFNKYLKYKKRKEEKFIYLFNAHLKNLLYKYSLLHKNFVAIKEKTEEQEEEEKWKGKIEEEKIKKKKEEEEEKGKKEEKEEKGKKEEEEEKGKKEEEEKRKIEENKNIERKEFKKNMKLKEKELTGEEVTNNFTFFNEKTKKNRENIENQKICQSKFGNSSSINVININDNNNSSKIFYMNNYINKSKRNKSIKSNDEEKDLYNINVSSGLNNSYTDDFNNDDNLIVESKDFSAQKNNISEGFYDKYNKRKNDHKYIYSNSNLKNLNNSFKKLINVNLSNKNKKENKINCNNNNFIKKKLHKQDILSNFFEKTKSRYIKKGLNKYLYSCFYYSNFNKKKKNCLQNLYDYAFVHRNSSANKNEPFNYVDLYEKYKEEKKKFDFSQKYNQSLCNRYILSADMPICNHFFKEECMNNNFKRINTSDRIYSDSNINKNFSANEYCNIQSGINKEIEEAKNRFNFPFNFLLLNQRTNEEGNKSKYNNDLNKERDAQNKIEEKKMKLDSSDILRFIAIRRIINQNRKKYENEKNYKFHTSIQGMCVNRQMSIYFLDLLFFVLSF